MLIFHDSYKKEYREPFGAALCGSEVRLRLYAPEAQAAYLHVYSEAEGEDMIKADKSYAGFFSWKASN